MGQYLYRSDSSLYMMKVNYQRNMLIGVGCSVLFFLSIAIILHLLPASPIVVVLPVEPPIFRDTLHFVDDVNIIPVDPVMPAGGGLTADPTVQQAGLFVEEVFLIADSLLSEELDPAFGGNAGSGSDEYLPGAGEGDGMGDFFSGGSMPYIDTTTFTTFDTLSRQPDLIRMEKPIYPPLAERAGVEGVVILEILVGLNGDVDAVRIKDENNPGYGFGEAAVAKAYEAKFVPALRGNMPVRCWVSLPVKYRLDNR